MAGTPPATGSVNTPRRWSAVGTVEMRTRAISWRSP